MIGNTSLRSFSSRDLGLTRISRLEKSFCSSNLDQVTMKTKVQSQPFSTSTTSLPHSPLPHTRDLVPLRTLQRRCFTRHTSTAPSPTVFYAVRLGHVPGIYISCRVAQPQTVGIPADVKRHSTTKAEKYMWRSPRDLGTPCSMILRLSSSLTTRLSPPDPPAGGPHHLPAWRRHPGDMGPSVHVPLWP